MFIVLTRWARSVVRRVWRNGSHGNSVPSRLNGCSWVTFRPKLSCIKEAATCNHLFDYLLLFKENFLQLETFVSLCKFVKDVLFFYYFSRCCFSNGSRKKKNSANEAVSQIHLSNEDLRKLLTHLILNTKPIMDQQPSHSCKSPLHLDFLWFI